MLSKLSDQIIFVVSIINMLLRLRLGAKLFVPKTTLQMMFVKPLEFESGNFNFLLAWTKCYLSRQETSQQKTLISSSAFSLVWRLSQRAFFDLFRWAKMQQGSANEFDVQNGPNISNIYFHRCSWSKNHNPKIVFSSHGIRVKYAL